MAKAEPPKGTVKSPKKKSGKLGFFTVAVALAFAIPFMLPTVLLLLIGMLPTYVALATDNDTQKSGAVSVGAMNFAGILPFIIDLWSKGQTTETLLQIMGGANTWIVILGASAVGQMIVYTIPQAIATLTLTQAESRAKALRRNLDTLKEA